MYDEISPIAFKGLLFVVELYMLSRAPKVDYTLSVIVPFLVQKM
jgi:hypothetical protein